MPENADMNELAPSGKRNFWPVGILVTFAVFVAGTVGLVVLSARNNVDLVRPDYYEQELRFQEQFNRRARTQALPQPVRVTYDTAQRRLTLALPAAHAAAHVAGEIQLYRPSSAGMDRRVPLQLDAQGRQTLDTAALSDGLWRVRVAWRVGNEDFAFDEEVVLGQDACVARWR
jgi:nitrogen fixation protein FixH